MWIQVSMLSDQTALDYNDDPQVDLVADDDQPYHAVIKPYERLMFEDSAGLVVSLNTTDNIHMHSGSPCPRDTHGSTMSGQVVNDFEDRTLVKG